MKNTKSGFIGIIIAILAALIIAGGAGYFYIQHENKVVTQNQIDFGTDNQNTGTTTLVSSTSTSQSVTANSNLSTYDNFGIAFQYPLQWGTPKESFSGNSLQSISFGFNASDTQAFNVFLEQDTNPQGTGLLNETIDQMITRFRTNDKYIYQVKDISANGIQGKELFYNSAVTGQPYNVEAYFPSGNNSYVVFSADYQSVSQNSFDSIISTFKFDTASIPKTDSSTGMAVYNNNGIRFEYPLKFDTDFASLNILTNIEKADYSKLDSNGCYPSINATGRPSSSTTLTINNIKFCSVSNSDVGAGQLYTDYNYTTVRNKNIYTIDYIVHTSNGCGVYENSPDINALGNEGYKKCLDAQKNFGTTVAKPIQDSIATFTFTNYKLKI